MFQPIYSRMVILAGAAIVLVPSGLAQLIPPPSRALVTFSDGAACGGSSAGPISFVALSATINATRPATSFGPASKLKFDEIAVTRNVDDCTVALYGLFLPGQRIREVIISYQTLVGTISKETLRMTLKNVLITAFGDTAVETAAPVERLGLIFEQISIFDPDTKKSTSMFNIP